MAEVEHEHEMDSLYAAHVESSDYQPWVAVQFFCRHDNCDYFEWRVAKLEEV